MHGNALNALAHDLVDFMRDVDPYGYADEVDDPAAAARQVGASLEEGGSGMRAIVDWLSEYVEEGRGDPESTACASLLLAKIAQAAHAGGERLPQGA